MGDVSTFLMINLLGQFAISQKFSAGWRDGLIGKIILTRTHRWVRPDLAAAAP